MQRAPITTEAAISHSIPANVTPNSDVVKDRVNPLAANKTTDTTLPTSVAAATVAPVSGLSGVGLDYPDEEDGDSSFEYEELVSQAQYSDV
jgi:hypothetical protein